MAIMKHAPRTRARKRLFRCSFAWQHAHGWTQAEGLGGTDAKAPSQILTTAYSGGCKYVAPNRHAQLFLSVPRSPKPHMSPVMSELPSTPIVPHLPAYHPARTLIPTCPAAAPVGALRPSPPFT